MSAAQHTPGPWRALPPGFDGSEFSNWFVGSDDPPSTAGIGKTLVSVMAPHATAYSEADARLIAAAPDLLLALQVMEAEKAEYMTINLLGNPAKQHSIKLARAAIAKATGGRAMTSHALRNMADILRKNPALANMIAARMEQCADDVEVLEAQTVPAYARVPTVLPAGIIRLSDHRTHRNHT